MLKIRLMGITKVLSVLLCACVIISGVPITGFAAGATPCAVTGCDGTYENGICSADGTHYEAATLKDGVYEIANAGQLYWFAGLVNGTLDGVSWDNEANGKLVADITVNPGSFDGEGNYIPQGTETLREWPGIGNTNYHGTFDGNKKFVSGLCYKADSAGNVGMFRINNGTIKNLTVKNSYFSGDRDVGAIVGYNAGTIENSKSEACTVKSANDNTGGIAGDNVGTISGCTSSSTVTGNGYHVGGITGNNGHSVYAGSIASMKGTVENCENTGSISGVSYVGGVVGLNDFELKNCHNKNGSVTGTKDYVGGVAGRNGGKGVITDCTNTGTVTSTGTESCGLAVGGVVGYNSNSVTGSSNSGSVSGYKNVGGVTGVNNSGAVAGCENSGTVTGVDDNTGGVAGNNSGGTIKNSKNTENGKVKGNYYVGGVVGNNSVSDSTDLNGSFNEATVEGYYCVGGVVGITYTAVGNCHNTGNVTSTGNYAGGVVGQAQAAVSDCYNTGDISCEGYDAGGVAGLTKNEITKCYNTGDVTGKGNRVGGIAGETSANITKCYNTGDITGVGESSYVGGIAGYSKGITSDCYSTGAVSGGYRVGAVIGDLSDSESAINNYYLENSAKTNSGTAQYGIGFNVSDVAGQTTAKTAEAFKSGEVAYLLNGSTSEGTAEAPLVWFQTCGEGLPAFSGKVVYANSACDGSAAYANDVSTDKNHVYKNGICACGEYEAATLKDGVYEIANAGQLYWFAGLVNGTLDGVSKNSKANAKLVADITVNPGTFDTNGNYTPGEKEAAGTTPRAWTPIGKGSADAYTGKFDGKKSDTENYTISGLYFNDGNTDCVGLFGCVDGAQILNTNVGNSYFKGKEYVAGVVGRAKWAVTINNCSNEGTVVGVEEVGGIVGYNQYGEVNNCLNGGVIRGYSSVGGVVGINGGTVTKCVNTNSVSAALQMAGGIVGNNDDGTVKYCYNTGSVASDGTIAGGVAGSNGSDGKISYCYNTGSVTKGEFYIGGIVGANYGTITDCYYLKDCASNIKLSQNGIGADTASNTTADTEGVTIVKTAYAFRSGEVAYLLNGGKTDGTQVWYQTLDGTNYPGFEGGTVYSGYAQCKDALTYANTVLSSSPHEYGDDGICKNCGGYKAATLKDGYYEIDNLGKLLWFADKVNNGEASINGKLTADIDATSVSYIGIGKDESHTFAGIFDGNNKTLKIALVSTEQYIAPFPHVGGATIKNLTVSGTVKNTHKFAAGIVGRVESGNATFENCLSLVDIDSTNYSGDGTHGGLIAVAGEGSTTTIKNCGFAGSIIGEKTTSCGGIVGWAAANVTIDNSYVAAKFTLQSNSGDTFARNQKYVTVTNCYYLNALSDDIYGGATKATDEQFKSGEVAYKLNGNSSTGVWKQTIGEDAYPNFASSKSVYSYTNCVDTAAYTNASTIESGSHDYNDNGLCTFDDTHYQPAVVNDGVYEIGNLGQLMWFGSKINSQEITNHKAKLMADITIDNSVVWTPISLADHCESSFEGGYHTITFANTREGSTFGLFGSYNYSTISNLYLKGSIVCNQSGLLGALANSGYRTTINNVISTVSIENSGDASTGGLIGRLGGKSTQAMIQNCAVYADIKGAARVGGFVGENWGGTQHCFIQYSVYKGDVTGSTAGAIMGYNGLQSKCYSRFTGVYYQEKDGLGICGGTYGGTITQSNVSEVTESQLQSGEVTYLLNNSSSSGVWKQTLGTDTYPSFTGKAVYYGYRSCADEQKVYTNDAVKDTAIAHTFGADGFCTAFEGETHYEPCEGKGTATEPYLIANAGNLYWFAAKVNGGATSVNAKLTANIVINPGTFDKDGNYTPGDGEAAGTMPRVWTPIGNSTYPYTGTFDGAKSATENYTISGLYYNNGDDSYFGLFGSVGSGATVKNIGVVNCYFSGQHSVGGVAADNIGTITNCTVSGTVSTVSGSAGGVVGNNGGEITGCSNSVTVTGGDYGDVGGVVGYNSGLVTNCYNTGTVTRGDYSIVGGVVGYNDGTITNCYNTGMVTGGTAGGVVGEDSGLGTVTNCYYLGTPETDDIDGTTYKTEAQFKSGEVTWLLNGKSSTEDVTWRQTLEGDKPDALPGFTGGIVYGGYLKCDGTVKFGNKAADATGTKQEIPTHSFNSNGFCTVCDGYEPCELEDGVYLIKNAGNLYWFADFVNKGGDNLKANAKLTADIVVNKNVLNKDGSLKGDSSKLRAWTPMGDISNRYDGTFDGTRYDESGENKIGNYSISGLYVNSEKDYIGLFGFVGSKSTVKNVTVKDSYIKGNYQVGGLAGCNYGKITSCSNFGTVCGESSVGGVAGKSEAYITGCSNFGTVGGASMVGGVVGYDEGVTEDSYNTGKVTGKENVGGVSGSNGKLRITNCYNTGAVSGKSYVGGVAGFSYERIISCYNTGTVSATGDRVGGVVGNNMGNITNSYNSGTVSATGDRVGGIIGFNSGGIITNCYYLGTTETDNFDGTTYKTEEQFKSGEVAYLLNESKVGEELVWKQTIGVDEYPNFTGGVLYLFTDCQGNENRFANESTEDGSHYYENGFCACGEYQPCAEEDGVYLIKNAGNLYWFAKKVNGGDKSASGKLTADITVNASVLADGKLVDDTSTLRQWTPIGGDSVDYTGTFDGQNHTISGLYYSGDDQCVGLFGGISGGATIQNVGVIDSYFKTSFVGYAYLGGIVGYAYVKTGSVTISGCSSDALLESNDEEANVGGVVGSVYSCEGTAVTIQGCYNTGEITATTTTSSYGLAYSGGVAGSVCTDNGSVVIKNSFSTGKLTAVSTPGSAYCGGVVGSARVLGGSVTIESCFSTGELTAPSTSRNSYSGGVAGNASAYGDASNQAKITLSNCYYTAEKAYGYSNTNYGEVTTDKVETKTAAQFASGEVAYLLQAGISSVTETDDNGNEVTTTPLVWGQTTSIDGATPILTSNEEYRVIPVKSGETIVNYSVLHMGDVNNNGEVDIYDYQQLVNIALSESNAKKETEKYDLNGDGVFDVLDCAIAEREGMSEDEYKKLVQKALDSVPAYREKADFDGDGVVDVLDVSSFERMLSGHRVRV